jgi:hypothetical protein
LSLSLKKIPQRLGVVENGVVAVFAAFGSLALRKFAWNILMNSLDVVVLVSDQDIVVSMAW